MAFPELFSDCSLEQLDEFMARAQPRCLSKPPVTVATVAVAPLCGNLLLDAGEECDCGSAEVNLTDRPFFSPLDVTTGSQQPAASVSGAVRFPERIARHSGNRELKRRRSWAGSKV